MKSSPPLRSASATPIMAPRRTPSGVQLDVGCRVGNWRIESVLGEGATGIVYEVCHLQLGTRRALKVLTWAHPMLKARLLREGRAQAALVHPNVVSVIDLISLGEVPALLMELVDGPSLEEWLAEHDPTPAEAEALFREVLGAVSTAHAAGIVHRDLKPANVLMARVGERWVPKVTDFGLAKDESEDAGLTKTGMTMGTPAYMAPEQIRSPRDTDARTDIFALGCLLYQLLAGEPPHSGPDAFTVMSAVTSGDVTRLERRVPGLERRLYRAVRAAMQRDPERRPASCAALAEILDGEPTPRDTGPGPQASWLSLMVMSILLPVVGALAVYGFVAGGLFPDPVAAPSVEAIPAPVEAPVRARVVPMGLPEPYVADDIDATLRPPPLPAEEVSELSVEEGPSRGTPSASAMASHPCDAGIVHLPWMWRTPDVGPWELKKPMTVHPGTPSEPKVSHCLVPAGAIVHVDGEPERGEGGRWLPVRVPEGVGEVHQVAVPLTP